MALPVLAATAVAGTALNYSASRKQAKSIRQQGETQSRALNYEAAQFDVAAGQTRAAGQYGAAEVRRQGEITQSDLVASVAAGGGDVSDPTIQNLIGRNASEINHRAMMEMYASEDEARTLEARAETARMGGVSSLGDSRAAASALRTAGTATALTGLASAGLTMAQYWKPPTAATGRA